MAWRRILCPVDFSEESRAALRVALDLCRRLGASLTLLHVRERAAPRIGPQGEGDGSLSAFRSEAEAAGVGPVAADEVDGDPRQDIAARAQAGGYDLVVMGTHGRTGRDRTLAGSVAESTVRSARCPVMVVHPGWMSASAGAPA
jgi:nucleotide-binding universal stress UspA family protein